MPSVRDCLRPKICQISLYTTVRLRYSCLVNRQLQEKRKTVEEKERIIVWAAICISAIAIAAVVILAIRDQQPAAEQTHTDHYEQPISEPPVETSAESTKTHAGVTPASRPSLNDIIRAARTWGPAYMSWKGRTAPDFTLTDITGKEHKLSDYRGKDVMIIFWATWCGPCLIEIPHLIALRKTVSEEELAMLAISNENPALVKNFAVNREINYTVFSYNTFALPSPYGQVRGIPCSFFIDSQGRIKLATEGTLSLSDMQAILQAQ